MGRPGDDVTRLRDVLGLLREQGLTARRLRVGGIELELATPPSSATHPSAELEPEEAHLSPEDQEREARELYDALQYGASEGLDN